MSVIKSTSIYKFYKPYINEKNGMPHSHLCMAGMSKGILIPDEKLEDFYHQLRIAEYRNEPHGLVEVAKPKSKLLFDLDIEVKTGTDIKHWHFHNFIQYIVKKVADKVNNKNTLALVATSLDTKKVKNGVETQKFGFHVIFPFITVKPRGAMYLRQYLLDALNTNEEFGFKNGLTTNSWEDIIDESICKVPKRRVCGASKWRRKKGFPIQCLGRKYTYYGYFGYEKITLFNERSDMENLYYMMSLRTTDQSEEVSFKAPDGYKYGKRKAIHNINPFEKKTRPITGENAVTIEKESNADLYLAVCHVLEIYADIDFTEVGTIKRNKKKHKLLVQSTSKECANGTHGSNHIYFLIYPGYIEQRCHNTTKCKGFKVKTPMTKEDTIRVFGPNYYKPIKREIEGELTVEKVFNPYKF